MKNVQVNWREILKLISWLLAAIAGGSIGASM